MLLVENYYQAEAEIIGRLKECVNVCHIQGVSDYFDVINYGAEFVQNKQGGLKGALFVIYSGETVITKAGSNCDLTTQKWVVAVVTKNLCKLNKGLFAQTDNGDLVSKVLCCLGCNRPQTIGLSKTIKFRRSNPPNYPQQDGTGLTISWLAFEIDVSIKC